MGYVINLKAETGLVDRSENTTRFYKDIKDYKPFSKEEEKEWFMKLKEAKEKLDSFEPPYDKMSYNIAKKEYEKIREHIILCNQRLVISAAKNYSNTNNLTDYINEINIGLSRAIDKFDVTKGIKFATYAMWYFLLSINTYRYVMCEMVKKSNYYKTFHVISKAKNEFMQTYEREPTTDELFELVTTKYKKDIVDKNDLLDLSVASIDQNILDDDNYACADINDFNRTSASYNDYEKKQNDEFNKELVSSLLDVLTPRERQIIEMRFGLYGENGLYREYELKEVADYIGISSERVRQIEKEAIDKMKKEYVSSMI